MSEEINQNFRVYTLDDLAKMPRARADALIAKATKIEGTAVVRGADGKIKYDKPELAGTYGETEGNGKT